MSPTPDPSTLNTAPESVGIAAHPRAPQKPPNSPVKARLRQFANTLKGNSIWMKRFLHGGK